jgi:hypothetical protein
MDGAKSAADIAASGPTWSGKLLQLQGNTAALRALDLAKVDASNRALQQRIWAMQDGQEAAKAADELRKAWTSVGDTIMDEVRRIRGLNGIGGEGGFATLMGRFNAATAAARGGDMAAAKSLPSCRRRCSRGGRRGDEPPGAVPRAGPDRGQPGGDLRRDRQARGRCDGHEQRGAGLRRAEPAPASNDNAATWPPSCAGCANEVAELRSENVAGHAANATRTTSRTILAARVTGPSGGDAIATVAAA